MNANRLRKFLDAAQETYEDEAIVQTGNTPKDDFSHGSGGNDDVKGVAKPDTARVDSAHVEEDDTKTDPEPSAEDKELEGKGTDVDKGEKADEEDKKLEGKANDVEKGDESALESGEEETTTDEEDPDETDASVSDDDEMDQEYDDPSEDEFLSEINEHERNVEDAYAEAEEIAQISQSLEEYQIVLDYAVKKKQPLDDIGSSLLEGALENIDPFLVEDFEALAMENFEGDVDERLRATEAALEGVGDRLKSAGKALIEAVKKMWAMVIETIQSVFSASKRMEKRVDKLIARAKKVKQTNQIEPFEVAGASKLTIDGEFKGIDPASIHNLQVMLDWLHGPYFKGYCNVLDISVNANEGEGDVYEDIDKLYEKTMGLIPPAVSLFNNFVPTQNDAKKSDKKSDKKEKITVYPLTTVNIASVGEQLKKLISGVSDGYKSVGEYKKTRDTIVKHLDELAGEGVKNAPKRRVYLMKVSREMTRPVTNYYRYLLTTVHAIVNVLEVNMTKIEEANKE